MAIGDPMILRTMWGGDYASGGNYKSLIVNGELETWANPNSIADSFEFVTTYQGPGVKSRQAGCRGSYGSYYQRCYWASASSATGGGELIRIYQTVRLYGNRQLPGRGHYGLPFTMDYWVRAGAGDTGSVRVNYQIREYDEDMNLIYSPDTYTGNLAKGTWVKYAYTRNIAMTSAAYIQFFLLFQCTSSGTVTFDLDDMRLYRSYTFARNPAIPDQQTQDTVGRSFTRSLDGTLRQARIDSWTAKYEKRLQFGMISIEQVKELRSFILLSAPVELSPYHPHMPDRLEAHIVSPDNFVPVKSLGPGIYTGNMVLSQL